MTDSDHPLRRPNYRLFKYSWGKQLSSNIISFKCNGTVIFPLTKESGTWVLSPNGRLSWYIKCNDGKRQFYSAEVSKPFEMTPLGVILS